MSNFKKTFLYSIAFVLFPLITCAQDLSEDVIFQLSWEKDFELILELNDIPTRGQINFKAEKESLEKEKNDLLKKKEILEKRLEILNNPVFTDKLYDEMLLEGTNDVSSTKESIQKKLNSVNERLDEINRKLRKLSSGR
ncbi:MAG: hypothetical protein N2445_03725 [Acidobacteria bacterium]|nr:hypothetical protein [Acidobacteriota bacterium]